jgi:acyl-CoA thioester hydrolase
MSLVQCPIRVYYEDTDLARVVYYANYLKFFERARTEWLRNIGIENLRLLKDDGLAFVVTECSVKYLQPAKMDDLLVATVESYTATKARASIEQKIFRDNETICTARVAIACFNLGTGKPARLPAKLIQ